MSDEFKLIRNYLKARKVFLERSKDYPDLSGNDNIIGRIGEFIAMQFLKKERPKKALVSNQCSWDIELKNGAKVSVRMITSENKKGKTTPIKLRRPDGTKTEWTELVLILMDDNKVSKIGRITRGDFIKEFDLKKNERDIITNRGFLAQHKNHNGYWKITTKCKFDFS